MGRAGIFVLRNTTTGKQYVGQSNDVDNQKKKQDSLMRNGNHYNSYIQYDYNTGNRFSFSILEYCNPSQLKQRKNYWIRQLNTYYDGYNQTGRQKRNSVNINQNTQQISWPEIWNTRSEVELNNYNRRIKRLKKWTKPYILLILLLLIIFIPPSIIIIILIFLYQYLSLYSAKKDYNSAISKINSDKEKIGPVTVTFIEITLKNILFIDFFREKSNTNIDASETKENISNELKNKQKTMSNPTNNNTTNYKNNHNNKNVFTPAEIRQKYSDINNQFIDEGSIVGVEELMEYAGVEYRIIEKNRLYEILE